jgi:hypothetical protein
MASLKKRNEAKGISTQWKSTCQAFPAQGGRVKKKKGWEGEREMNNILLKKIRYLQLKSFNADFKLKFIKKHLKSSTFC